MKSEKEVHQSFVDLSARSSCGVTARSGRHATTRAQAVGPDSFAVREQAALKWVLGNGVKERGCCS